MTTIAMAAPSSTPHTDGHLPQRPSWDCRACKQAWPCPPAHAELRASYGDDRIGLSVYLAAQMQHAATEVRTLTPAELFTRFLAWDRPANHPPPQLGH